MGEDRLVAQLMLAIRTLELTDEDAFPYFEWSDLVFTTSMFEVAMNAELPGQVIESARHICLVVERVTAK